MLKEPYSFLADPKRMIADKGLTHEPDSQMCTSVYKNMMWEPNVIRGNTNSIHFQKKYGGDQEKNGLLGNSKNKNETTKTAELKKNNQNKTKTTMKNNGNL